ncbi:MAG: S46 family peptidase, partial [Planctomycetota bacterium]
IKHASRMRSLANTEKRSRGQLLGLRRAKIVQTRAQQEAALQAFIDSDAARSAKYGSLLKDIEAVDAELSAAGPFEINLVQLRQACRAAAFGYFVYDAAVEREKSDLERETPYMDRNFPQSVQELQVSMSDWHLPTDQILLAGMLERLSRIPAASDIEPLRMLLAEPGTLAAKAEALIAKTRLGDLSFVQECLKKTPAELQQVDDPLLRLIVQLHPVYLSLRETEKSRDGRLSQLYGSLIEVKQQFLATSFIPDANGTLRFTCGRIKSYSPTDAVIRTPISTLRGVIEKTTGVEPFITPQRVLKKYEAGEFGRFVHPRLGQVPVAILYDTDTTGGNSGSPVLNSRGQLVGVNFDRCFEATINDFAWNKDYSRSIGVDIRYVLWITGIVYEADHLLKEMGVE